MRSKRYLSYGTIQFGCVWLKLFFNSVVGNRHVTPSLSLMSGWTVRVKRTYYCITYCCTFPSSQAQLGKHTHLQTTSRKETQ